MHILLADDAPNIRKLFGLWFRGAPHTIRVVKDGAEAVAAVESEVFDAIILDIFMPVMDGWEALKRIRQLPNGKTAAIAVMSAAYERVDMEPALEQGADAIFSKPLDPGTIVADVEAMVVRSSQVRDARRDLS